MLKIPWGGPFAGRGRWRGRLVFGRPGASAAAWAGSSRPTKGIAMTITYDVAGMTCGHCVASTTTKVSKVEGVQAVQVDLKAGRVTVTSETPVDPGLVVVAVDAAGYAVTGLSS